MKSILFQKNYTENWFHEIFSQRFRETNLVVSYSQCERVEKQEILYHWKKISSNQLFSNFYSKTNAFTKFLRKKSEREFMQFPYCALWIVIRNHTTVKSWFHETFFNEGKIRVSIIWTDGPFLIVIKIQPKQYLLSYQESAYF